MYEYRYGFMALASNEPIQHVNYNDNNNVILYTGTVLREPGLRGNGSCALWHNILRELKQKKKKKKIK